MGHSQDGCHDFFNAKAMNLRSRIFIWNILLTFLNKISLMDF